jgi:signal transduction histidine kinase
MKPKELEDLMEIINLQVRRGEKLISNVQKLSQIQEEDIILEKVNINEYLEKALDFLQNSFKNKDINVSINSFKKKIFVEANELLLDVFENILINTVKYNQNSTIRIEIDINKTKKSKKSNIKIEFSDNGIGIPDGRKERIFERGYKNKSSVHGMGLGLSLVKNILDNYNAQIYVKDKDPQNYKNGSKFIILFPMLKRDN